MLYPRLPDEVARNIYAEVTDHARLKPALQHFAQTYAPVGGRRATEPEIERFAVAARDLATQYGFPEPASDSKRIQFDRAAAALLGATLELSWAEASSAGVWSFIALVVLPDLTAWRFKGSNVERWIASDLTRHTWARLWWQWIVFQPDLALLDELSESDLNQLLERRSIGGDPRLVVVLGRGVLNAGELGAVPRRALIRDVTARAMRQLAYIDVRSLDDDDLHSLCSSLVQESLGSLGADVSEN